MEKNQMIKVLILCRGNVTRSPFIAGYLNHLYRNSDLHDKMELDIDSSGIEGKFTRPPHPRVIERGLELGFDLGLYRSKHSTIKSLEKMDIIFVVDKKQYSRFEKVYTHLMARTFHFYAFGRDETVKPIDLEDPSESNTETDFNVFFRFTEAEIIRVWEYIEQKYREAEAAGTEFNAELFTKTGLNEDETEFKYKRFSRRSFPLCPHCQSKRIRRVKRKGLLRRKVYPRFKGYPYHCGNCDKDFILYIGPDLKSGKRSSKKSEKWKKFIRSEMSLRDSE